MGRNPPRQTLPRVRTLCEQQPALPLACAAAANGSEQAAALRCDQPRCSLMGVAACEEGPHRGWSRCLTLALTLTLTLT